MKQLKNYIITETKKILNEELGINKEVQEATSNILEFVNEILSDKKNYGEFFWDNNPENKVYGVLGHCEYTLFNGYNIQLYIQMCIFDDREKMKKAYETFSDIERYYFSSFSNAIVLHFPAYRPNFNYNKDIVQIGLKNTRIRGTLSHEIKHAFQFFKKRQTREILRLNSYKKSEVYTTANEWAKSKNTNKCLFGYAIYYCFPTEITANMESLFTNIKQNCNDLNEAIQFIKTSELSRTAQATNYLVGEIINNHFPEEIYVELKNDFNRDKEWLIKHLNKGLKLLKRCLKRATILSKQYFGDTQPTE